MGVIPWASQYQNGDVAAKALMLDFDGDGDYLQPSAAKSLRLFANEFEATFGIDFTISEAFRDIPTQERLYDLYRRGIGNPAAVPGTSSHGQGLAVDINSWVYGAGGTIRHQWLVDNAPRFGWSWELVGKPSGEPWHFNYVGGWDDWITVKFTPDKTPEQLEEEEIMANIADLITAINGIKPPVNDTQFVVGVDGVGYVAVDLNAGTYHRLGNADLIKYLEARGQRVDGNQASSILSNLREV
jgi:hypothetical protein